MSAAEDAARRARLRERERRRSPANVSSREEPPATAEHRWAAGARRTRGARAGASSPGPRWPTRLGIGALVLAAIAVLAALVLHDAGGSEHPTPKQRPVTSVLIPEGSTRHEIATTARRVGLTGSYLQASTQQRLLQPAHYGASRAAASNPEGFLFPATYELYAGSPASELVADQLEAFRERFGPKQFAAARALHQTPYGLLTVASMVEREAGVAKDRPLIAAVIYNRLAQGMPLGIDSTLRYALGDYAHPLTQAQLQSSSPYNTRLHKGLPPTPISNPGLEAIEAAAHPAHVNYLYYVAAPDGCGESVFSDTYEEFLRNVAAYQRALSAHGGRVPVCRRR
jgi:uncharacterized YceG family protein